MAKEVGGEQKLKEESVVLNVKRKHWEGGRGNWCVGREGHRKPFKLISTSKHKEWLSKLAINDKFLEKT